MTPLDAPQPAGLENPKPGAAVKWTAAYAEEVKRSSPKHWREFQGRTGYLIGPIFVDHPGLEWDVRYDDGLVYGYPLEGLELVPPPTTPDHTP